MRWRPWPWLCAAAAVLSAAAVVAAEQEQCKVLNKDGDDTTLQFAQYTSREKVLRQLLKRSVDEVRRAVKDVQEVGFEIKGEDVKEKVGQHSIRATIQPSGACFILHYKITPVNECEAPKSVAWRHRCHESTECEDTEQSYNCVCPQGYEGEGTGKCGGKHSTAECCGPTGGDACKHAFVCVPAAGAGGALDECKGQCAKEASCALIHRERNMYECQCPDDLPFGNGKNCYGQPPPRAIFDRHDNLQGKRLKDDYCGCQAKTYDYCIGVECGEHASCVSGADGSECICDQGYTDVGGRCVDRQSVKLTLIGPERVKLVQGDEYNDELVRVMDENGMLHEPRFISINYDSPHLNEPTLDEVGVFHITYTIRAEWTSTPSVTVRRTIEVADINECALRPGDPKYEKWRPRCHPFADCVNTRGGYKCVCRKGSEGGGAAADAATLRAEGHRPPANVGDGVGCRDVQPPVLVVSDWEKRVKVCKCESLAGPDSPTVPAACQQRNYALELSELLLGKERRLCTEDWPCFQAYDDLPTGERQNLTHRVQLGPEATEVEGGQRERGVRRFVLPVEVKDDAGNAARSQLTFAVEEISLWDLIRPERPPRGRSPTLHIPKAPAPAPEPEPEDEEEEDEEQPPPVVVPSAAKNEQQHEPPPPPQAAAREAGLAVPACEATAVVVEEDVPDGSFLLTLIIVLLFCVMVAIFLCGGGGPAIPVEGEGEGGRDEGTDGAGFTYMESPNPGSRRSSLGTPGSPMRSLERSLLRSEEREPATPFSPS